MTQSRRFFLMQALAAALAGSGCRPKSSVAPSEKRKLRLFYWSEYLPKEVIEGFTRETGIPTSSENYSTNEDMIAKLAGSSQYDIIQPSEYAVEYLIKRGMLAALDAKQLPNIANLLPEYRKLSYDPGNRYSVPYMAGTVGIIVNTAVIKEKVKGFRDLFQSKYSKRIIVPDDNREIVSWAFAVQGIPINDMTPENLAKVTPMLKEWIPLIKKFDSDKPKDALLRGEVDLGVVFCGDAAKTMEEDAKFVYILPVEGTHRFIDNLCIPATSKNKEVAHQFINYVLRPGVSKIISDKFPYTNPNAEARKLLSPAQLHNPASYPPNADKLELFHDIGKASTDVATLMTELRG